MTSFTDTSLLMGKQKVVPIAGWDKALSQLKAWAVFCTVLLGYDRVHRATYKMFLFLEEKDIVSLRLRAQACQQPTFPTALLCLIQQEFNESFHQTLERRKRVRWTNFESLPKALATGNFRPELITLPAGLVPLERPLPPPISPRRQAETPQAEGNNSTPQAKGRRGNQVQEHNPHPAPHMQIGPGFGFGRPSTQRRRTGLASPRRTTVATFACRTTSKVCATCIVAAVTCTDRSPRAILGD